MKSKSKSLIVSIIVVAVLILGAIGASYAWFAPYIGSATSTTATVRSNTVDNLVFRSNTALSLVLTQTNMAKPTSDTYVNSTNTLWGSSVLYPRSDAASHNSSCTYKVQIVTATNAATGQAANTLRAIVNGCPGGDVTVDLTAKTAGQAVDVCTVTVTASSTSAVTNTFKGVLQFKNSATVDQTSLAGKSVYTGNLVFANASCAA